MFPDIFEIHRVNQTRSESDPDSETSVADAAWLEFPQSLLPCLSICDSCITLFYSLPMHVAKSISFTDFNLNEKHLIML